MTDLAEPQPEDNVVSLFGGDARSDRKHEMLITLAEAFNNFVADKGVEPEALVFALAHADGTMRTHWIIEGDLISHGHLVIARASTCLAADSLGKK